MAAISVDGGARGGGMFAHLGRDRNLRHDRKTEFLRALGEQNENPIQYETYSHDIKQD